MHRTTETFPSCYLETTEQEVNEYYQPKDFRVGDTLFVYGRRFLLLNCDAFTRKYFAEVLKQPQGNALSIKFPEETKRVREIPEYVGLGTPEDSLASCFGLTPKAPRKDIVCLLMNANKYLRFGAVLDNVHPEDSIRQFVIFLSLADGKIKINEPPIRNSGIRGGLFLKSELITRPGTDPKMPEYYGPRDFHIGATLIIHSHRFRIVSADLFVYRYMQEHAEMFAPEAIEGVRNFCLLHGDLAVDMRCALEEDCRKYLEAQKTQVPPAAGDDMEQCLRNVNAVDAAERAAAKGNVAEAEFVDAARRPGVVPDDECQYYVNSGDMKEIEAERRAAELRKQQESINPAYYVSGRCRNEPLPGEQEEDCCKPNRGKTVHFGDKTKCSHNISTGNCLTCCP